MLHVPKTAVEHVHKMTELRKKHSSILFLLSLPRATSIVALVAVPKTIDLNEINAPEQVLIQDRFEPFGSGAVAVLHDHKNRLAFLERQINHLFTIGLVKAHWLFAYHMEAKLYR